MISKLMGDTSLREKAIEAAALRNEVIAQNIANVETPGYKRKTVQFEEYLDESMSRGLPLKTNRKGHISSQNSNDIKISADRSNLDMRLDGNNVDIENEMALMAENSLKYNTLVQNLNNRFKRLESVISEGKR